MSCKLIHPSLGDNNVIFFLLFLRSLIALFISCPDNVLEPMPSESTHEAEEKLPLREFVGELIFRRQVHLQGVVFHCVIIKAFDRQLSVVWDVQVHYILLL